MAKLFVSYSRKDSIAARKLIESFKSIEQDVWVDWESIPPAVDWLEQIFRGIEEADAFIFLISPDSIASEVCKVEIGRAALNNKRIIPIVLRDVAPKDTPESIRKLNWTYLREADNFEEGLAKVKTAIELDLDWLEEHRRLQVRALEWHRRKDPSLLLRGRDLRNAYRMMETATAKDPTPTDLQTKFVLHSRQNQRNRTIAVIAGGIALVLMAVLAFTARQESIRATENEKIAVTQRVIADQKRNEAEQSAEEANRQKLAADEAREKEAEARALAETNEKEAEAQRSAARAQIYQNRPGELFTSTLLAIDSLRRTPTDEAEDILRRNLSLLPVPVTQVSQGGKINALAFNPEGNIFVTASADGTACAWRIEEENVSRLFCTPADRPGVNAVAFSPDGSSIVMGDQSGLVQVLDAETGSVLHAYLRVEPQSGSMQLVDIKNGTLQDKVTPLEAPVRGIGIRPGGKQIAVAYDDGRIPVFDPNSGKVSSPLWTGERPNVLGFSPNGSWLVAGSESGRVTIWNVVSQGGSFSPSTHRRGVLAIAFSPKDNKLVTGGNDSTAAMISLSIQKELFRIPNQSSVRDLAFSPDSSWFVTASDDHRIRIWDALTGDERLAMSQDGIVTDVVVSSKGRWIATTGNDRTARVWDAETGAGIFQIPLKAHGSLLAFCNEDKWLLSTDERGAIEIWDISRVDVPMLSMPSDGIVENVQYSPSGQRLAVSSEDKVWLLTPDSESGLKERALGQPVLDLKSSVQNLIFSHDANLVGVVTQENEVGVYNIEQGKLQLIEGPSQIQSIAFSPDSQQLITSDTDGSLQAWSVLDGALVSDVEGFPQGSVLASAGDVFAIGSQGKISILNADGNGGLPSLESGADHALLVVSADGSLLASSSSTGEITILRYQDTQLTEVTSFVKDEAASLAFHPAGTLLAVGTAKNVYLIDTASGKELARTPHLATVNGVSFSADGDYLATASSKTLQIWEMAKIQQIKSDDLIPAACLHLFENLSPAQWEAFFTGESYEHLCETLPVPQ